MVLKKNLIYIAAIVTTIIYALWRATSTLPWGKGLPVLIAGFLLLVAEIIGFLEAAQYLSGMANSFEPDCPQVPEEEYPEIDVLIPTYDEPYEILLKTINGAVNMDYPDKSKVHIYICDDTDRPWVRELAERFQVGYFRRDNNEGAKAGNLNHALEHVHSELVAIFDADMIPMHDFLTTLVPYFFRERYYKKNGIWLKREKEDPKKRVGFIQSPQGFYNNDLFQYNLYSEQNVPNEQDFFFRTIQLSRNCTNAAIFAGSNAILSRKALDEVGGFYTKAITEDLATGFLIQSKKYKGYSVEGVHAHGLAPTDLKSLFRQRERWARGTIQTFRQIPIFLKKRLTLGQRFSYMATLLYWYTPLRKLIFILAPIVCGIFGWVIIRATWIEMLIFWLPHFLLYNFALKSLSSKVRSTRLTTIYDTILFPKLLPGVILETFGIKKRKFAVTKKEKVNETFFDRLKMALPHLVLILLSMIALIMSLYISIKDHTLVYVIVIFWQISNLYDLVMAVMFLFGRDIYRKYERFYANIPMELDMSVGHMKVMTDNISEGGVSFYLQYPEYIPDNEEISLTIKEEKGRYVAHMKAKIVHVAQVGKRWKYSMQFLPADEENRLQLYSIIYDREPSHPTEIIGGNSAFFNIKRNIKGRLEPINISNRKLPRINTNQKLILENGQKVQVINFNYEYILFQFENTTIPESQKFTLNQENGLILECQLIRKNGKQGLYHIENYRTIATDKALRKVILSWMA